MLSHQNCTGLWENKVCKDRAGNSHKFMVIQFNESAPYLCTITEHQGEFRFGSRNQESHKYTYKYDMGQGTGLNTLHGLKCHPVRNQKQMANSRPLSLRNLSLVKKHWNFQNGIWAEFEWHAGLEQEFCLSETSYVPQKLTLIPEIQHL